MSETHNAMTGQAVVVANSMSLLGIFHSCMSTAAFKRADALSTEMNAQAQPKNQT